MRDFLRAGLVVVCLLLVFCQGTAAFNVSHITVDPRGALIPGTPVVITGTIDFIPSSDETFPHSDEFQFATDLTNPTWNYSLYLDGKEQPQPGISAPVLSISGWVLSYPATSDESMRFTLEGIVPLVSQTQNKTFLQIQEIDERGILVPDTRYVYTIVVVNPSGYNMISESKKELGAFKYHIEENAAQGINTTLAEAKYTDADQRIKNAEAMPSTKYIEAYNSLKSARNDIDDGEVLLDKAWAEKEVADAQVPINKVDAVIWWFKGNSSTADDPQLPAIIAKREVAMSYLITANDEISNGNFKQARVMAQEAYLKANESYNDALSRKDQQVIFCWGCSTSDIKIPVTPLICTVAIILLIAGIFWWKRSQKE